MGDTLTSLVLLGLMILVPLALIAVGVLMALSAHRSQTAAHAAYAEFAKRVNGQLIASDSFFAYGAPREIRFHHGKTPCSLLRSSAIQIPNKNPVGTTCASPSTWAGPHNSPAASSRRSCPNFSPACYEPRT